MGNNISVDACIQIITANQNHIIEIKNIRKGGGSSGFSIERYHMLLQGEYLKLYADMQWEVPYQVLSFGEDLKRIDSYSLDYEYIQLVYQDRITELTIYKARKRRQLK